LLRLEGAESRPFLDALITQDLEALDAGPVYAALLSPQGKLICDFYVWPEPEGGALIDCDPARSTLLEQRLRLYLLRRPVKISRVETLKGVWVAPRAVEGYKSVPDPRRPEGSLGWRLLGPAHTATAIPAPFTALRLAAGVPDLVADADIEEVFGLEALLEELNGVDFRKGCFIGQENVSRMKRRATTRRKFCPIAFDGPPLPPTTPVLAGPAALGTVRSGQAGRALALLRLDRAQEALAQGTDITADGRPVRLDPPPWLLLPPVGDGGET
jgi:hypothetical protein